MALTLAFAAPLIKAEGVAVGAGVVAYELLWRRPPGFTWKTLGFLVAPIPFAVWQWTAQDLVAHRAFGLNILTRALDYLRQILLPFDLSRFYSVPGGRIHHLIYWTAGTALYVTAAVIVVALVLALRKRQTYGLWLFALAGTSAALVVTLAPQSRYVYLACLTVALVSVSGAWWLAESLRDHVRDSWLMAAGAVLLIGVVVVEAWMTTRNSDDLRAAHKDSVALRTAVLRDHPDLPDGTAICIANTRLDSGSATVVFADPRLGPNVGIPIVTICPDGVTAPSGVWVYKREADGDYMQAR